MIQRLKQSRRAVLVALVGFVLLALLLYRLHSAPFQWQLFLNTFYRVDLGWLAGSVFLMLLTYVGRALRWEVMLRPLGRTVSIRKLTYDTAIGFTAVVLLGRPGELVRPYLISISAGVPFSSQMAAWLLERILDLLAVLLLFGFGLTRIPSVGLKLGAGLGWVLGAGGYLAVLLGAACIVFLILFRNFADPMRRRLLDALAFLPKEHLERAERMIGAFSQGMQATRDRVFLTLLVVFTVIEWVIIVGSYYTLFRAMPATSSFNITDVVIFLGFVAFGSLVQIPGIGGGIQIAAIVVLTEIYHLPLEAATGLAVFLWIITVVVVVPFGLLCAFHEGINWSKLKHLKEDVPV
jgi:glycosyltransferase 2 family protein